MSIAFDSKGTLWATAIEGIAMQCYETTPYMKVDLRTGEETLVGWTGQWYKRGGDIPPATVHILHRAGPGKYVPLEIPMSALDAHLAHGVSHQRVKAGGGRRETRSRWPRRSGPAA